MVQNVYAKGANTALRHNGTMYVNTLFFPNVPSASDPIVYKKGEDGPVIPTEEIELIEVVAKVSVPLQIDTDDEIVNNHGYVYKRVFEV